MVMAGRTVAGVWRAVWTRISSFCRASLVGEVKSDIVGGCLLENHYIIVKILLLS